MWMSMAHAITRNHMKVFPLTTKGKEATFAVALMTAVSQLRKRDIEGFIDNAYPHTTPRTKVPRQETIEKLFKIMIKMLKYSSA